jgi:agmatinase
MSTFMPQGSRFLGLEDDRADTQRAGVVLIPVPFEKTSSYGNGSASGPAAILSASQQVELFDTELGFEPWRACGGIATRAPLTIADCAGGEALMTRLERAVYDWLGDGAMVITLAGEHTGVVGAIRAHAQGFDDLTVLQLDAHSDLRERFEGDPWSHACTMARVLDFHQRIVQVGIRSESREERALADELGLPVFRGESIQRQHDRGIDWIDPIIAACSRKVYITLDCDVFDPTVVPATGTPEPGGLTWMQMNELLLRLCRERQVVGFDISELAPIGAIRHPEFTVAKLIYRLIGLVFKSDAGTWKRGPGRLERIYAD